MPYLSLKAEMAKKGVTIETIADELNLHRNSVSNKLKGKGAFSIEEATIIQAKHFSDLPLKYLFKRS